MLNVLGLGFGGTAAKLGLSQIEVAPEELDEVKLCGRASATLREWENPSRKQRVKFFGGKNKRN